MSSSQTPTAGAARARAAPAHAAAAQELVLGRYRLQRPLGSGGFATVWAARDERLQRDVAVKVLPRDRVLLRRFELEARAAARLSDPAIVLLYEAALDEQAAYLVSELVRGKNLRDLLNAGRLSDRDVLQIAISICDALAHAHAAGVIHRDVKPSNILVPARRSSAGAAAKLTDFGVARVLGSDSPTQTGEIVGTEAYMAPEQALGREADAQADIYALALVIYEGLTGVNPAAPRGPARHLPPLRRQRRGIAVELASAVDRALRPDPLRRGTLQELRAGLAAGLQRADEMTGVITARGWLGRPAPEPDGADGEPQRPGREWQDASARDAGPQAGVTDNTPLSRRDLPLRALGSLCAALTAWWLCVHLLNRSPLAPSAVALIAGGAVLALPRLALALGGVTLAVLAVAQGLPGAALLLALVLALTACSMPRDGRAWPLPAGAVLLAAASLAGAWPALAGRSGARAWRRAGIAAAGYMWLAAASALLGRMLYAPVHPAFPAPEVWTASLQVTLHDVLLVMLHSGLAAGAGVWALAAVLAPWVVRGRSLAGDVLAAGAWAALTLLATDLCVGLAASSAPAGPPRGALLGAVLGAAILLAPRRDPLAGGRARLPLASRRVA